MTRQIPSVGRIVHLAEEGACRAAVITQVDDVSTGLISLAVLHPDRLAFEHHVPFDHVLLELNASGPTERHWHWPEKTTAPLADGAVVKEL